MSTTTRSTLSDDARTILSELGISVISDDPSGRFPTPGGYVALGDAGSGPYEGDEDTPASAYRFEAFHDALESASVVGPDETRMIVGGLETPPYEGAVAYVRNTSGEYGIRYHDGHTDWLGSAGKAFGDETVEFHPDEVDA